MIATIGQMRSFVTFQKNVPTDTDTGGEMESYVVILETRGYLRSRSSGGRSLSAGQFVILSSHELTVRCQEDLINAIDSSVRVVIDEKYYTVDSWELVDEKRFYYKFQLNASKSRIDN